MSSGFGKWYEDQQQTERNGGSSSTSSWFDSESLPLFNMENMPGISLESMRESMEAQMPRKILGMGYQQRFQVGLTIGSTCSTWIVSPSHLSLHDINQVFCALLVISIVFFALAFFVGLPTIALKPQKFALSFTCGSLTFMGSFGILKGPMEHLKSMFAGDRLLFTTIYFGSMLATLYLTFSKGGLQGYVLVLSASAVQVVALIWYLISFLPGGAMGLTLVTRVVCSMLQPVFKVCCRLQAMCMSSCVGFFMRAS
jgi:Got1/Sft2-like family